MKKVSYLLIILVLFFNLNSLLAQETSGIIKYKAVMNEDFKNKSLEEFKKKKDVPPAIRKQVIDMYLNDEEDNYELHFKDQESYFHYIEKLKNENSSLSFGSKAGINDFYVNLKDQRIIEKSSMMGLLKYDVISWKVKNETKLIGDYKCFKAEGLEKKYMRDGTIEEEPVVAWFTPEIPLQFGPHSYNGLPGLILRIDKEESTVIATEIMLNPEEKIKIDPIKKDAKVRSRKEAYQIATDYYNDTYGN
ncbi:GLPGLI family protein [Zunongwangia sp. HRR-M8]|uniref:GLPGLI family protein n=1 Tax=Zunongwangia sp. HRR-M8 TaxID=3015170 RepID=UPI0022DDEB9D|nr:GLPGLI family protein [Zunongwangia sp. HRR-M8]WBL21226.1 GLPGLI family protein [Zunongwangia sp. HRR-M8]